MPFNKSLIKMRSYGCPGRVSIFAPNLFCVKRPETTEEQFLEIFYKYSDPLFQYVLRLTGNEETAKDIVQECFTRVWENIEKIDWRPDLLPLLVTYIKNLLRDEYRKKKHYKNLLGEMGHALKDASARPVAEESLALQERQKKLADSLGELSEKRRQIFSLVKLQGLSYKEVSENLDVSIADIKKQIRLSLQHLRKVMNTLLYSFF